MPKTDRELEVRIEEQKRIDFGLLEPAEPTPLSHQQHILRMESEFSPRERRMIRWSLGLGVDDAEA